MVTGKVTDLKVYEVGSAFFNVQGSFFILWTDHNYTAEKLLWFSMLKEAVANDLDVVVDHPEGSGIPIAIYLRP